MWIKLDEHRQELMCVLLACSAGACLSGGGSGKDSGSDWSLEVGSMDVEDEGEELATVEEETTDDDDDDRDSLFIDGQEVYLTNCAACHGSTGEGGGAPAMGSVVPALSELDIQLITLYGIGGMPPVLADESDAEAVAVFVYDTWGGD